MLEFLLALLTTATVAALLVPLLRRRVEQDPSTTLGASLAIHRDQLAEIERERAQGLLPESEAAAARLEIERRLLAAADSSSLGPRSSSSASALHRLLPPALSLAIPLLALGLYLQLGAPGFDPPRAPVVAQPGAPVLDLGHLRRRVAEKPDDAEAQSALGEALTLEADGTVTPHALAAFRRALQLAPADPRAAYYLGRHEAQSGDSRAALERWLDLEARAPDDAPYLAMLRAEIERVARAAGLDPLQIRPDRRPPASAPRGPTQDQVEAMQSLTGEQRQQAIRGMVDGLAARLADNPTDRAGWLRLAQARRVLGEAERAAEAYAKADGLQPLDPRLLSDWAEVLVRRIPPGAAPSTDAVAVLERLERAEPRNALALFYLGAASLAAGDKPAAARRWKTLLEMLPSDAPIRGMLEEKIKETE
ncbi:MAG: c-type cytochrome biogenesis protein CcmI [Enhydrobacter sp.]|nr:MAG: c-type cytochrome biogenesis protein CcmI [Enhydrobacter sp.]